MKNILFFSFLYLLSISLFSKQIDVSTAEIIAKNYASVKNISSQKSGIQTQLIKTGKALISNQSEVISSYYIFNINQNEGFVIIAADDVAIPVLGYSNNGSFDTTNIPSSLQKLLFEFNKGVALLVENNVVSPTQHVQQWDDYISGNIQLQKNNSVAPLTTTQWSQRPNYNLSCPDNAPTGCVATAVGQILKYYNHPVMGSGYYSYNHDTYGTLSANFAATQYKWSKMPNKLVYTSPLEQKQAISELLYHVGVSLDMDYSPTGSGAFTYKVPNALKTYFKYSNDAQLIYRSSYSLNSWKNKIKEDLNKSRVVYHSGFCPDPQAGHAFVVDGYDENDLFHINWGWGGSFDGYFEINNLNPGSTYTWNQSQSAIIKIYPLAEEFALKLESRIQVADFSNSLVQSSIVFDSLSNPIDTVFYLDTLNAINSTPVDSTFLYDSLNFNQPFFVHTFIHNDGVKNYNGTLYFLLFSADDQILDTLGVINQSNIAPGTTKFFSIQHSGLTDLITGYYKIGIYFISANKPNMVFKNNYINPLNIKHIGVNSPVFSSLIPANAIQCNDFIERNKPFTFSISVTNKSGEEFLGYISVDLHQMNGNWIDEIDQELVYMDVNETIQINYTSSGLSNPSGTYKLVIWQQKDGENWKKMADGLFPASKEITLGQLDFTAMGDGYEENNTPARAFVFYPNFYNDEATINTYGSSIHIPSDVDFYNIKLEEGYEYTIQAKIHDAYLNQNGMSYTNDVVFSYLLDGKWVGDYYDDVDMPSFKVLNNTSLTFGVMSFYPETRGTYELEIHISRERLTNVQNHSVENKIRVFPNPSNGIFQVQAFNSSSDLNQFTVRGVTGNVVFKGTHNNNETIDLSILPTGTYWLEFKDNNNTITTPLIIQK